MHCQRHGDDGGGDFFQWMDESLDERVRSMVVRLMLKNDRMAAKIQQLENDLEGQKLASTEENERKKWKNEAQIAKTVDVLCNSVDCGNVLCDYVH